MSLMSPSLPYALDALEPHISRRTLECTLGLRARRRDSDKLAVPARLRMMITNSMQGD
jgi:Iron/manganese superoxide dismutases, alpha-hairpin domain